MTNVWTQLPRAIPLRLPLIAAIGVFAIAIGGGCGGGSAGRTPAAAPVSLHIVNETACVIHFRFDNGQPKGRVQPRAAIDYTDAELPTYQYINIESTQAIFHTYGMKQVRDDGYTLTVKPASEDHPCVEKPEGAGTVESGPSPIR